MECYTIHTKIILITVYTSPDICGAAWRRAESIEKAIVLLFGHLKLDYRCSYCIKSFDSKVIITPKCLFSTVRFRRISNVHLFDFSNHLSAQAVRGHTSLRRHLIRTHLNK